MRHPQTPLVLLLSLILRAASATPGRPADPAHPHHGGGPAMLPQPLPLVIWHGLGDKFDNQGLQDVGALAQRVHPGTHVYFVKLDDDAAKDQQATFFGNVTEQITRVCAEIKADERLRQQSRGSNGVVRVDAMGFSQGGQFLRGLVERCEGLSVRSLVTFGSQHNGIAEFQSCGAWDFLCKGANAVMRGNAWTEYVQSHLVPAQYYRTLNETTGLASDDYLRASGFLADINNEREGKNEVYAARLAGLDKFVMYVFANDTTVIPKESGWFAEVNGTSGKVTLLRERPLYLEDWLGFKELDKKDALVFRSTPGEHMALSEELLKDVYTEFFGPEWNETRKLGLKKEGLMRCDATSSLLWSTPARQQQSWDRLWFWQRWQQQWSAESLMSRFKIKESL